MNNTLDIRRFALARPASAIARVFHLPRPAARPAPAPRLRMIWTVETATGRLVGRWRLDEAEGPKLSGNHAVRTAPFAFKLAA